MNFVIIGAGPAGVRAAETLRENDSLATVTLVGAEPGERRGSVLDELGLDAEPAAWREGLARLVETARQEAYDAADGRMLRHATGRAMDALRGRVPAAVVV